MFAMRFSPATIPGPGGHPTTSLSAESGVTVGYGTQDGRASDAQLNRAIANPLGSLIAKSCCLNPQIVYRGGLTQFVV